LGFHGHNWLSVFNRAIFLPRQGLNSEASVDEQISWASQRTVRYATCIVPDGTRLSICLLPTTDASLFNPYGIGAQVINETE
jgi:hypothetical protein